MTPDAVINFLASCGIPWATIHMRDGGNYRPLEERWVFGQFAGEWDAEIDRLGLRYEEEREDCDDFGAECHRFMCRRNRRARNSQRNGLAAWARIWFPRPDGLHEANLFLTTLDGDLGLRGFEPQRVPDRRIRFTRAQLEASTFVEI